MSGPGGSRKRSTRGLRRGCFIASAAFALIGVFGPFVAPARAQSSDLEGRPVAYVGDGEAFGSQVLINTVPAQFFADIVNGRSPWVTTHFDASSSSARASMLNPGYAVTGIATLCQAGIPCDAVPNFPPPYPLMATAGGPVADATAPANGGQVAFGPFVTSDGDAHAHAGRDKVTADANTSSSRLGASGAAPVTFGSSTATNVLAFNDSRSLVSTSIATVHDVNVVGQLHIDQVEGRSISTTNADGTRHNDVRLDVSGATLAGQPVTITNEGIAVGGPSQGGSTLTGIGSALTPALSPFRGNVRTLGTTDTIDASGASASANGIEIDIFPNTDSAAQPLGCPAGQGCGVSPIATVLLAFAGSHSYTFDPPPIGAIKTPSGSGPGGSSSAGTPGTPGTPGQPAVAGVAAPGVPVVAAGGTTIEELVSTLLKGPAAERLKWFYLSWTLSLIGLALGSRLRPARLNGGIHGPEP